MGCWCVQINNEREVFLKRLQAGIVVLKHGRQGKPKARVLSVDERGEMLVCREQGNEAKECQMPLADLQVSESRHTTATLTHSQRHGPLCPGILPPSSKRVM